MLDLLIAGFMLYLVATARKWPILGLMGAGGLTVIIGMAELDYTFKAVSLAIIWLYTILSTVAKLRE